MTLSTLGLTLCLLCVLTAIVLRERVRAALPADVWGGIAPMRQADRVRRLLLFPVILAGAVSLRPWLMAMTVVVCVASVLAEGRACRAIAAGVPQRSGRLLIASRLAGLAGILLAVGVIERLMG